MKKRGNCFSREENKVEKQRSVQSGKRGRKESREIIDWVSHSSIAPPALPRTASCDSFTSMIYILTINLPLTLGGFIRFIFLITKSLDLQIMQVRFKLLSLSLNQTTLTLSHSLCSGRPQWKKKGPVNMP